jgi:hypothetical protein
MTMQFLMRKLWRFAKDLGRIARRSLWNCAKSYAQVLSIMAGCFYLYASYRTPPGHLLNWSEFRAVFFDVFNHLMIATHAGGCGQ